MEKEHIETKNDKFAKSKARGSIKEGVLIRPLILLGSADKEKRRILKERIINYNNEKRDINDKDVIIPFLYEDFREYFKKKMLLENKVEDEIEKKLNDENNEFEEVIFIASNYIFIDIESSSTYSEIKIIEKSKSSKELFKKLKLVLHKYDNNDYSIISKFAKEKIGFVNNNDIKKIIKEHKLENEDLSHKINIGSLKLRYSNNIYPFIVERYKYKNIYKDLVHSVNKIDNEKFEIKLFSDILPKVSLKNSYILNIDNEKIFYDKYKLLLNSFFEFLCKESEESMKLLSEIKHYWNVKKISLKNGRKVYSIQNQNHKNKVKELNDNILRWIKEKESKNSFAYLKKDCVNSDSSGTFSSVKKHFDNKSILYYKIDIKSFFSSIQFKILKTTIDKRDSKKKSSYIKDRIKEEVKIYNEKYGSPVLQGFSTSGSLSHIYLSSLDELFDSGNTKHIKKIVNSITYKKNESLAKRRMNERIEYIKSIHKKIVYTRYSDDILISTNENDFKDLVATFKSISYLLSKIYKLKINEDKSEYYSLVNGNSFKYLGVTFNYNRKNNYLYIRLPRKKKTQLKKLKRVPENESRIKGLQNYINHFNKTFPQKRMPITPQHTTPSLFNLMYNQTHTISEKLSSSKFTIKTKPKDFEIFAELVIEKSVIYSNFIFGNHKLTRKFAFLQENNGKRHFPTDKEIVLGIKEFLKNAKFDECDFVDVKVKIFGTESLIVKTPIIRDNRIDAHYSKNEKTLIIIFSLIINNILYGEHSKNYFKRMKKIACEKIKGKDISEMFRKDGNLDWEKDEKNWYNKV